VTVATDSETGLHVVAGARWTGVGTASSNTVVVNDEQEIILEEAVVVHFESLPKVLSFVIEENKERTYGRRRRGPYSNLEPLKYDA
jgi:hypothetical protein